MKFAGFIRKDGKIGIRNHLLVISNGSAAGCLTAMIAGHLEHTKYYVPPSEFGRNSQDRKTIARTLIGLAANANTGAILIVGMKPDSGYPELSFDALIKPIMDFGKPVDTVFIQDHGFHNSIGEGIRKGRSLLGIISRERRRSTDFGSLCIGVKCGYSDPTSGICGNVVAGNFVDQLIDAGGTVFFSETTEVIGAEHIVAKRFSDEVEQQRFLNIVQSAEKRALSTGEDIRSINPVPANIEAGITTLEEKSLGAVAKSGTKPILANLDYAQIPSGAGLYFVDSWMATVTLFLGFTAAGAVLNVFQVGGGWLPGNDAMMPGHSIGLISPSYFMTGNPKTYAKSPAEIDFNAGTIINREENIEQAVSRMVGDILDIASGALTKVETLRTKDQLELYFQGPTL
jgi:altronate dehydratase large subunit